MSELIATPAALSSFVTSCECIVRVGRVECGEGDGETNFVNIIELTDSISRGKDMVGFLGFHLCIPLNYSAGIEAQVMGELKLHMLGSLRSVVM